MSNGEESRHFLAGLERSTSLWSAMFASFHPFFSTFPSPLLKSAVYTLRYESVNPTLPDLFYIFLPFPDFLGCRSFSRTPPFNDCFVPAGLGYSLLKAVLSLLLHEKGVYVFKLLSIPHSPDVTCYNLFYEFFCSILNIKKKLK